MQFLSPDQTLATFQSTIWQHCWAQHVATFGHRYDMLHGQIVLVLSDPCNVFALELAH